MEWEGICNEVSCEQGRMGHHVEVDLQDVETEKNRETDVDESSSAGSDHDSQLQQLDDTERAILERLAFKRGKADATLTSQQQPSLFDEQETMATQAHVFGGRVTARKRLEVAATGYESPLFNSCFKLLFEMTAGAHRETSADLMEFLAEELAQVQKRCQTLVQVGGEAGYASPAFQRAVATWRSSPDMAYQAEQAQNVTFEEMLERLRQLRECKKRKYADPPALVDVYRQACERLTVELLDGAVRTPQPVLLLELLLEDFHHVQRRQQALFRAESAAHVDASSESMILTAGHGLSVGRESVPVPSCSSARSSFTLTQWQEFEHQALIFKYMVAGVRLVNIPDDILGPIRNNCIIQTARHLAPSAVVSGALHTTSDPEPGRCRRTDGKKWRCARETLPEKKYCERHMHRGRHRARPPQKTSE